MIERCIAERKRERERQEFSQNDQLNLIKHITGELTERMKGKNIFENEKWKHILLLFTQAKQNVVFDFFCLVLFVLSCHILSVVKVKTHNLVGSLFAYGKKEFGMCCCCVVFVFCYEYVCVNDKQNGFEHRYICHIGLSNAYTIEGDVDFRSRRNLFG